MNTEKNPNLSYFQGAKYVIVFLFQIIYCKLWHLNHYLALFSFFFFARWFRLTGESMVHNAFTTYELKRLLFCWEKMARKNLRSIKNGLILPNLIQWMWVFSPPSRSSFAAAINFNGISMIFTFRPIFQASLKVNGFFLPSHLFYVITYRRVCAFF